MIKGIITDISHVLVDISHDIGGHLGEITAFSLCFLVVNGVNWQSEIIRFSLGITASIISGYVVNRLKKYWDKPKPKTHTKKTKIKTPE
jgi:hypothetical protein